MPKSVLVVDDEMLVRWAIEKALDQKNLTVSAAPNGQVAIKKIAEKNFDLVITDLLMPGLDGIELAKKIRELRPESKVLLITAYSKILDRDKAREAGIVDIIEKPFMVNDVKNKVNALLYDKK